MHHFSPLWTIAMGCGGSKQQTNAIPPLSLNNKKSQDDVSLSASNKQKVGTRTEDEEDNRNVCEEQTIVQPFTSSAPEEEENEITRHKDVDDEGYEDTTNQLPTCDTQYEDVTEEDNRNVCEEQTTVQPFTSSADDDDSRKATSLQKTDIKNENKLSSKPNVTEESNEAVTKESEGIVIKDIINNVHLECATGINGKEDSIKNVEEVVVLEEEIEKIEKNKTMEEKIKDNSSFTDGTSEQKNQTRTVESESNHGVHGNNDCIKEDRLSAVSNENDIPGHTSREECQESESSIDIVSSADNVIVEKNNVISTINDNNGSTGEVGDGSTDEIGNVTGEVNNGSPEEVGDVTGEVGNGSTEEVGNVTGEVGDGTTEEVDDGSTGKVGDCRTEDFNNNGGLVKQVKTDIEKTKEDTKDDQLKFNQSLRSYCRLVNPDAMKTVATHAVTELYLERALPGIGDVFTHILANIGQLTVLDLSGNHIGPQAFHAVVLALKTNKTLRSLNVSNNKTDTQCSESLGIMLAKNDTLEELDVSSNQLGRDFFSRSVGLAMNTNSTLRVLRCASCGFADLSILLDSLSGNSTISELDFSHNHIVNGTELGEKLAVLLAKSSSLSVLKVKATNISGEGMQKVQKSLEANTVLTNLHIGGNQMLHCNAMLQFLITCFNHVGLKNLSLQDTTFKEIHLVFDDITANQDTESNLIQLNLSNCCLVDSMFQTLVGLMPSGLSNLHILNVTNNNGLTSDRVKDFAQLTSDGSGKSNLQELIYGVNEAENLPFSLSMYQNLSSLDLRKCQIATSNLVQVAFFMNKPDGISSLCLDGQKLSGTDVLQVMLSNGSDNSLESLSLIGCALNDDDMEPITSALKSGLGLKSLKLSANRITDNSIEEMVQAFILQEDYALECIHLANNKISCEGAIQISKLLLSCSALHTLILSRNHIGANGLKTVIEAVRSDSRLRLLDLNGQAHPIDEEDMEEILTVLAHALGYTVERNEYGQVSMSSNGLVSISKDLTVLLTNLGSMTGNVGQAVDGCIIKTDYSKDHWPYLGLQEVLTLSTVLKGHSPTGRVHLTKEEWNLIIGEGKDPCVPSWLQVDTHRDRAVYLAGLPASVSANRLEGDLDSEADCVISEVCIMKDPILQKPNGLCWILMSDTDSVEKAVRLYESGQARLFNQAYIISRLDVIITDVVLEGVENKAQEEMERRAKQRVAENEEHRALLETSFVASKARHEYAAANPAYADGRVW
ncbi:uncharacterized protein [Antedon mediterranea]|uniref:uncharacterized protein n=1 Tax=Antedon mediterranea TaxID=105859 RepID=UPI003AF54A9A